MASNSTTSNRESRAITLIEAGAVTLNLDGTATVRGSGKARYLVTKQGCPCPDYTQRGQQVGPCKHLLAVSRRSARCTAPARKRPAKLAVSGSRPIWPKPSPGGPRPGRSRLSPPLLRQTRLS